MIKWSGYIRRHASIFSASYLRHGKFKWPLGLEGRVWRVQFRSAGFIYSVYIIQWEGAKPGPAEKFSRIKGKKAGSGWMRRGLVGSFLSLTRGDATGASSSVGHERDVKFNFHLGGLRRGEKVKKRGMPGGGFCFVRVRERCSGCGLSFPFFSDSLEEGSIVPRRSSGMDFKPVPGTQRYGWGCSRDRVWCHFSGYPRVNSFLE